MKYDVDPQHWLRKYTPDEWIRTALGELHRAEEAYRSNNARAGLAGCRRAAGMALNAALIVEPNDSWGRSYADHLVAIAQGSDESIPEPVRSACRVLMQTQPPSVSASLVSLRTPKGDEKVLEATRDVIAHGYAVASRHDAIDT